MQLSEKILSFFPGLRSRSTTDSAPSAKTSTPAQDSASLFDRVQSQVQAESSTPQPTTYRESTLEVSTSPTLYAAGAPIDGRLATAGQPVSMLSAVVQEVGSEYASMSGRDFGEFLNTEFDTVDCAQSMTALGSFTNELRHVVSFQTIAVTPPTKSDAGVVVSIPTDELTQDSMEALAKLLEKYGVATTGFMRESESEVRPMETEFLQPSVSESALILGVHIPVQPTHESASMNVDPEYRDAPQSLEPLSRLSSMSLSDPAMPLSSTKLGSHADTSSDEPHGKTVDHMKSGSTVSDPLADSSTEKLPEAGVERRRGIHGLRTESEDSPSFDNDHLRNVASMNIRVHEKASHDSQSPEQLESAGTILDGSPQAVPSPESGVSMTARAQSEGVAQSAQPEQHRSRVDEAAGTLDVLLKKSPAVVKGRDSESLKQMNGRARATSTTDESTRHDEPTSPADAGTLVVNAANTANGASANSSGTSFADTHREGSEHTLGARDVSSSEGKVQARTQMESPATHMASTPDAPTNVGNLHAVAVGTQQTRGSVRVAADAGLSSGARVFRVTMERFVPQASAILSNMAEQAESTAKLILTPESLGTIVVNMKMQEHQSTVHLEVANAGTRDLVQANIGLLKDQCAAQGVRLENVAVTVREPDASPMRFENGNQQSRQQRREDAEARSAFVRSGSRHDSDGMSGDDARGSARERGQGQRRRPSDDSKFERYA